MWLHFKLWWLLCMRRIDAVWYCAVLWGKVIILVLYINSTEWCPSTLGTPAFHFKLIFCDLWRCVMRETFRLSPTQVCELRGCVQSSRATGPAGQFSTRAIRHSVILAVSSPVSIQLSIPSCSFNNVHCWFFGFVESWIKHLMSLAWETHLIAYRHVL